MNILHLAIRSMEYLKDECKYQKWTMRIVQAARSN